MLMQTFDTGKRSICVTIMQAIPVWQRKRKYVPLQTKQNNNNIMKTNLIIQGITHFEQMLQVLNWIVTSD